MPEISGKLWTREGDRNMFWKNEKFVGYLGKEIGIEYKACLYFFALLFFQCCYLWIQGRFEVSILCLTETIASAYVICYIQVYLLGNFDEAERLSAGVWGRMLVGMFLFTGVSYFFAWFDRKPVVTFLFALYVLLMYVGAIWINKIKRTVDTEKLNDMLKEFQSK